MFPKIKRNLSLLLLISCGTVFIWASVPIKRQMEEALLKPEMMEVESEGQGGNQAILEERHVRLAWPGFLRIGDSDWIELEFNSLPDSPSQDKTAGYDDAYKHYNLLAEARYEVAGMMVEPANPTRKTMPKGQSMNFKWKIRTDREGQLDGRIWLSLRFVPVDGSDAVQRPVYVQDIRIGTKSIFGLSGQVTRAGGGMGVLLSGVLLVKDVIGLTRKHKMRLG